MPEHVPTTEDVRETFARHASRPSERARNGVSYPILRVGRAWFDRWLAAHDREVAAKTLREAASRFEQTTPADRDEFGYDLLMRADALGTPEQEGKI